MKAYRLVLFVLVIGLPIGAAWSHDEPADEKPEGPWSGSVAFGYLSSSGNTDDSTTTFNFAVGYNVGDWRHSLKGGVFAASSDEDTTGREETTDESYQLGWKSIYDLNDRNYLFGALDWRKDRFASYVEQAFETAGYGRRLLKSDKFTLDVEIGAGFAQQELAPYCPPGAVLCTSDTPELLIFGDKQNGGVANVSGDFIWNINEQVKIGQEVDVYGTSDNTYWETNTSIRAGLTRAVSLVVSYKIEANTELQSGDREKKDTYTTISLDYAF